MSQKNNPVPAPSAPPNPNPKPPLEPHLLPPPLSTEMVQATQHRAQQEIAVIEHQARAQARINYPLEPLPRAQSNKRSVKRTRFTRKEVERVLAQKIREKVERNRELDRLIEIEIEKHHRIRKELEEVKKLPDRGPELVRVHDETPDEVICDFLAQFETEDNDHPSTAEALLERPAQDSHFEAQYGDLANSLIGFQPFADASKDEGGYPHDCEPLLDPRCLLDPTTELGEELEINFHVGDDEPAHE